MSKGLFGKLLILSERLLALLNPPQRLNLARNYRFVIEKLYIAIMIRVI